MSGDRYDLSKTEELERLIVDLDCALYCGRQDDAVRHRLQAALQVLHDHYRLYRPVMLPAKEFVPGWSDTCEEAAAAIRKECPEADYMNSIRAGMRVVEVLARWEQPVYFTSETRGRGLRAWLRRLFSPRVLIVSSERPR